MRQRSKYGVYLDAEGIAERTYKGVRYGSKFECDYAKGLDIELAAKQIRGWRRQVPFHLHGKSGQKVGVYYADFEVTHLDGSLEYVDTKGRETDTFRLKMRWLAADYPDITLRIVRRS